MMAGGGFGRPGGAAAAPGLWQAGDPGFIRPIANVGLQVPGVIQIAEQAIPPPFAPATGHIYSFGVAGISELHYMDSVGVITQLTGAGGILFHSLQNAYDDGQVITTTAPLGTVRINNPVNDASNALELNRTIGTGYALSIIAGDVLLANLSEIQFNNATQLIRGNGVDMEFTNTSLLGDMVFNSTVEIREEINSIVRTILTSSVYLNQVASTNNELNFDTYSATAGIRTIMRFRKSRNNTLGILTQTITGDRLGKIEWRGVNTGPISQLGALIYGIQNGAAGAFVPTDLRFETYSSTAINTNQFILRFDGLHSFAFGEIQPIERVDDADHAVGFDDWYIAIHTLAANDRSVTIAAAQEIDGRVLNIKLEGAPAGQKVIINPNSNIEGAATLDLTVANESVSIIFDGVQWQVFG